MRPSRGIAVLGMHRNGTSLITRGLQSLGVYLGDDFLDTRPDNPTGYWENRAIVAINERVLTVFGLKWEDVALIANGRWTEPALQPLAAEAAAFIEAYFLGHRLWAFKDPRTIRLLPFWQSVFAALDLAEHYVVVIRNPLSVVRSLKKRQGMEASTSYLLWLLYMVPHLNRIAGRSFVVVDYDLVMADPRGQMKRIARQLDISLDEAGSAEIERFASEFVDPQLRHSVFGSVDFDTVPHLSPLSRRAYHWLQQLASDRIDNADGKFWSAWRRISDSAERLVTQAAAKAAVPVLS
jgi:O-antigen biosynthesis protein